MSAYNPVFDIIFLGFVSALWIAALNLPTLGREIFSADVVKQSCLESARTYGSYIGVMMLYAVSVSIVSVILGGAARLVSTVLCFILATIVAFSVTAIPIAVIKLVDFGDRMSSVSQTMIATGPWIYVFILLYIAVLRIHKTVPQRVIAYMGLGVLPIVLLLVLVHSGGFGVIP